MPKLYRPTLNYREVELSTVLQHAPCEKTLLLRNYPPVFLLTYGDSKACPDAV